MPKILIVSDTHGNYRYLNGVLKKETDCTIIIHLGDYYEDIEEHTELISGKKVFRVPGIMHPGYFSGKYPFYVKFEISGINIACVHSLHDFKKIPGAADITFFGHTHKPELIRKSGRYLINPGHLKKEEDRGNKASYCILEISDKGIFVRYKDYRCNLQEEIPLDL